MMSSAEVLMVDWTGDKPAYRQVADKIRERIAAGEFEAGDRRLPSLSALEAEYGATTSVVREAIRELKADGLVVSHQGKGAFLSADASTKAQAVTFDAQAVMDRLEQMAEQLSELTARVATLEGTRGRSARAPK